MLFGQTHNHEETEVVPNSASTAHPILRQEFNQNQYFSTEFEKQIRRQKSNVVIALCCMVGVFVTGVIAAWILVGKGMPGTSLEYMKLGTVALTSFSLPFPLKMYLSFRVRCPIYEGFKRLFDYAESTGTEVSPILVEDARKALSAIHKLD